MACRIRNQGEALFWFFCRLLRDNRHPPFTCIDISGSFCLSSKNAVTLTVCLASRCTSTSLSNLFQRQPKQLSISIRALITSWFHIETYDFWHSNARCTKRTFIPVPFIHKDFRHLPCIKCQKNKAPLRRFCRIHLNFHLNESFAACFF